MEQAGVESDSPSTADRVAQLRERVGALELALADATADADTAQQQLESLTYAAELTREEVTRRRRENSELRGAEEEANGDVSAATATTCVLDLEEELLNAKHDAAIVRYDVEQLEFQVEQLRRRARHAPNAHVLNLAAPAAPRSPSLRSPTLTSFGSGLGSGAPPSPRHLQRLIADVDALVTVEGVAAGGDIAESYASCRLGVTASGDLALFSYNDADPVAHLERSEEAGGMGELSTEDVLALRHFLYACDAYTEGQCGGGALRLCGLHEAVVGTVQVIADTSSAPRLDGHGG